MTITAPFLVRTNTVSTVAIRMRAWAQREAPTRVHCHHGLVDHRPRRIISVITTTPMGLGQSAILPITVRFLSVGACFTGVIDSEQFVFVDGNFCRHFQTVRLQLAQFRTHFRRIIRVPFCIMVVERDKLSLRH